MRFSIKSLLCLMLFASLLLVIWRQHATLAHQRWLMEYVANDLRNIVDNGQHLMDAEIITWQRDPTTRLGWRKTGAIDTGQEIGPAKTLYTLDEPDSSQVKRGLYAMAKWLDGKDIPSK